MNSPDFTARTAARMASLLMPDEQVIAAGKRHWLSYSKAIFLTVLALICAILGLLIPAPGEGEVNSLRILLLYGAAFLGVLAMFNFALTAIINWTMVMAVTTRRVFMRTGLIARDIVDIPLAKVDIVNLEQGVIDRIFGCGNVLVRTVGEVTTTFPAIATPTDMRNAIVQAMETIQQRQQQVKGS